MNFWINIKIAIRNQKRNKLFTFINISGLSLGLACCMAIVLYVSQQLSYDKYHENSKDIYLVGIDEKLGDEQTISYSTQPPVGATLKSVFPSVENYTRVMSHYSFKLVKIDEIKYNIGKMCAADSTFFDIFTVKFIIGNKSALRKSKSIVLTKSIAVKYFGTVDKAINRTIEFDEQLFRVSAIIEDCPVNTELSYNALYSIESVDWIDDSRWDGFPVQTYIRLKPNSNSNLLEEQVASFIKKYIKNEFEIYKAPNYFRYFFKRLTDVHLRSTFGTGSITYVMSFIIIAIFILLIAIINFSNLSTARASTRACEIGIKKTLGSSRKQLMWQFFTEAIFISFIAFIFSLVILESCLPLINNLIGVKLQSNFYSNFSMLGLFVGIAALTGIFAGSYSAFYLSSFNPVNILKGELTLGKKGAKFRSFLVIFQFSISIFLIISTLIISKQMNFINNKDLGFKKENLIKIVQAGSVDNPEAFKQELLKIPNVNSISFTSGLPGESIDGKVMYKCDSIDSNKEYGMNIIASDSDFCKTMQFKILAGRFFSRKYTSDSQAVILNETAVKKMGLSNPIGAEIRYWKYKLKIIGVIKDFHYKNLKTNLEPIMIMPYQEWYHPLDKIAIKLSSNDQLKTIKQIEKVWNEFTGDTPMKYTYFDNIVKDLYKSENNHFRTFMSFSIIAIFIACIGLLGLITYTIDQKYSEIGIRKVYGAPIFSILLSLNLNIIKWIIIAFLAASPLAFYFMKNWLLNFAYRIDIGVMEFFITALFTILITLSTVSWQVLSAVKKNPIDAINHDN